MYIYSVTNVLVWC